MKWIRVAAAIDEDAKVWAIADDCGVDGFKVVGHLVRLWGTMTEHAKNGELGHVSDTMLERWARWDGRRGAFAQAVRAHLCDEDGAVSAWEKYQGAAIREAEQDAESARARRALRRAAHRGDVATMSGRRNPDRRGDVGPHETRRDETEIVAAAGLRERDDGEVDGSPVADLTAATTQLTSAVNRGVTDGPGESTRPLRVPAQFAQVEAWLAAGVDMAWARQWLYEQARAAPPSNRPGSLKYFAERLLKAWEEHQASQLALTFVPAAVDSTPRVVRPTSRAAVAEDAGNRALRAALEVTEDFDAHLSRRYLERTA